MRTGIALLLCCALAAFGAPRARSAADSVPAAAMGAAGGPVALDGDLDTPVWRGAPSIALTQQNPFPGKPTPFATSVRLLHDGGSVTIVLDTFGQKKLAYVFQVNARGARADGAAPRATRDSTSNTT